MKQRSRIYYSAAQRALMWDRWKQGESVRFVNLGQAQRVAMCRALINEPDLILADEPLGNQDKATGRDVLELLLEMAREADRTVVMVTHDPESAEQMQRVIELSELRAAS